MVNETKFIINDFLLFEEFCNLRCDYCSGFYPSEYKFRRSADRIIYPPVWNDVRKTNKTLENLLDESPKINTLFNLATKSLDEQNIFFEHPILKISGGEIFLVRETINFIEQMSKRYRAIQLLTNGTLLKDTYIAALADLKNIYFQISLDGHTITANKARTKNQKTLDIILGNIEKIQERNIPLEINCVLTKYNTHYFSEFVSYMSQYPDVTIFPRLVRREPADVLFPKENEIENFNSYVKTYVKSSEVNKEKFNALPPKSYLNRVSEILLTRKRDWKCYVPFFVMGSDMYGNISSCTLCSNSTRMTNIFEPDEGMMKMLIDKNHHNPENKNINCPSACIVQYEMFNLFMDEEVSEKELLKIPTFRVSGVLESMKKIKDGLNEN